MLSSLPNSDGTFRASLTRWDASAAAWPQDMAMSLVFTDPAYIPAAGQYYLCFECTTSLGIPVYMTVGTGGPPPANAPTSLMATETSGQVALSWTPPTGFPPATSYIVAVSTSPSMTSPILETVTGTSTLITGLMNGSQYYFQVTGISNGVSSTWSSQISITPMAAPTLVSATIAPNGTTLTLVFTGPVSGFVSSPNGFVLTGFSGPPAIIYTSGTGTNTIVYTISPAIGTLQSGTIFYMGGYPLTSTTDGQLLGAFGAAPVTNNSTQPVSYTIPGTFSFQATATSHAVQAWGAGAGGGVGTGTAGNGGGGGGYASSTVTGLTIGNSYAVVVGAGGTSSLGFGGNSSFNSGVVVAEGGQGNSGALASACTGSTTHSGGNGGVTQVTKSGGSGGGGSGGTAATGNVGTGAPPPPGPLAERPSRAAARVGLVETLEPSAASAERLAVAAAVVAAAWRVELAAALVR